MNHYTYLIGWRSADVWYYGARSCEIDPELDLWKEYFTSSKYVPNARDLLGEPDVVRVHKTYPERGDALEFETKFLKRVGAVTSERWLNRNSGGRHFTPQPWSEERKVALSLKMTGVPKAASTREKMKKPKSASHRESMSRAQKGVAKSDKHKASLSAANKGKPSSPQANAKISATLSAMKWVNNGTSSTRVKLEEYDSMLQQGYMPGRVTFARRTKAEMFNTPRP